MVCDFDFCKNMNFTVFTFNLILNFDPVKGILKIRYQLCILMKKVIILRIIEATMEAFGLPFSTSSV